MNNCYCGRPGTYQGCCKKIHQDIHNAITAEDLMRSRYSAFVLAKGDYLMKSQHSATRTIKEKKDIQRWAKSVHWIRLEVLNVAAGTENDSLGSVEFKAIYQDGQGLQMIHENASFTREHGHWVYLGEA